MIFRNRSEAGKLLAARLTGYGHRTDVTVVALPRGGVPVGYEIACALHAPLDVLEVRKLGVPENPEFAMGAIASGDIRLLDKAVIKALKITPEQVDAVTALKKLELQRQEQLYRSCREPLIVRNRLVILTDDGVATGWTIRAAIASLRAQLPTDIVVAVPVAAPSICQKMKVEADRSL